MCLQLVAHEFNLLHGSALSRRTLLKDPVYLNLIQVLSNVRQKRITNHVPTNRLLDPTEAQLTKQEQQLYTKRFIKPSAMFLNKAAIWFQLPFAEVEALLYPSLFGYIRVNITPDVKVDAFAVSPALIAQALLATMPNGDTQKGNSASQVQLFLGLFFDAHIRALFLKPEFRELPWMEVPLNQFIGAHPSLRCQAVPYPVAGHGYALGIQTRCNLSDPHAEPFIDAIPGVKCTSYFPKFILAPHDIYDALYHVPHKLGRASDYDRAKARSVTAQIGLVEYNPAGHQYSDITNRRPGNVPGEVYFDVVTGPALQYTATQAISRLLNDPNDGVESMNTDPFVNYIQTETGRQYLYDRYYILADVPGLLSIHRIK